MSIWSVVLVIEVLRIEKFLLSDFKIFEPVKAIGSDIVILLIFSYQIPSVFELF